MTKPKLSRRSSKLHPVPLGLIEIPPAYLTQRPFIPSLGNRITAELDLDKLGFPIMNHRGGKFLCCDGQHRVYALRTFGFKPEDTVLCEVYEGLTDAEMAEIFLGRDDRRAISPFVKFHIACTAGHVRELAVQRMVEAQGLVIARERSKPNAIGAVTTLCKIYDTSPANDVAVGWVVRVAKHAFNGDPAGFDREVLETLGLMFNRYNGRISEKELIARLAAAQHGIRGLMRRAEALRERTGNQIAQCLSSVFVEVYNKGLHSRGSRLAPWWRGEHQEVA